MKAVDFDTAYDVQPGKHFYQFYKNREDYFRVVIPYFKAGLKKGEACLWIVSEAIGIAEAVEEAGFSIPRFSEYLNKGQLEILPAEEWYYPDGIFDQEGAINKALEYISKTLEKGFPLLRAAGDAGGIPRSQWSKVQDYEARISDLIRGKPVIGLCIYPILECTLTETKAVVGNHDSVLVAHF